uniref:Uncharacterized protein n=1 Tax=Solanum tuberosum TaxID=4113 RepID=K7VKC9_SOLTU|nr:hypothetical protein [Solanum tuberosum]
MEPANLHQQYQYHQLQFQDQFPLIGISPNSSSSSNNSCYGGVSTTNTWTPCTTTTTILNNHGSGLMNSYSSGDIINTTNSSSSDPLNLVNSMSSTTQDLEFHQWANNNIKQENSYPKFTQMLTSPSSIEEGRELSDMNAKLLLGTLSNTGLQLYHGDIYNNNLLYLKSSSISTNRGRLVNISHNNVSFDISAILVALWI